MNKEEFNSKSIEEQVSIINNHISFDGSLRKACKDLGMNLSTVQNRFKKSGYVLKDGSYYKSVLEDKKVTDKESDNRTMVVRESDNRTMVQSHNTLDESIKLINYKIRVIQRNFLEVGKELQYIFNNKTYVDKGYTNFYKFCNDELRINTTLVKNLISVYRKFGVSSDYVKYNFSQLVEMVSLPEEVSKEVKPTDTVKQIRNKKKELKEKTSDMQKRIDKSIKEVDSELEQENYYYNRLLNAFDKYAAALGLIEGILESDVDKLNLIECVILALHNVEKKGVK